jgi:hypothetical protein
MELAFTVFERINLKADLINLWVVISEGSASDYFGWYFWHFYQYPVEVTDI